MLLLGNMTNTFKATNFMSSFKVHNCYLRKILFDLQYVQINLIKSLYNRVLCLIVVVWIQWSLCVCVVGLACALCWGKNITPGPRWAHSIKGEGAVI